MNYFNVFRHFILLGIFLLVLWDSERHPGKGNRKGAGK